MSMSIGASIAAPRAHAAAVADIRQHVETPVAKAERVAQPPPAGAPDSAPNMVPARVIAAQTLEVAARPGGNSAPDAPREKIAVAQSAKDMVASAEEKVLQALIESTTPAAEKPAAPGAEGAADADAMALPGGDAQQAAEQKLAVERMQAQVAEVREVANGGARTLTDIRA